MPLNSCNGAPPNPHSVIKVKFQVKNYTDIILWYHIHFPFLPSFKLCVILHVKMAGSVLRMILASALMHSVVQHAAHQVCVHS